MDYKIYRTNNIIFIVNKATSEIVGQDQYVDVKVTKSTETGTTFTIQSDDIGIIDVDITQLFKKDGTAYTISGWVSFYTSQTGSKIFELKDGESGINKFGKELITGSGVKDIDIVGNGNDIYIPPTANRTHQIKSASVEDKGTLIGTYGSTTFEIDKLIDSTATFISDGVSVGDVVVNDTIQDHSLVISVDSETQLTVENWHHTEVTNIGDVFRVGSPAGTGSVFVHIRLGQQKDGTELTEFILMNGTTNVPTINPYFRVSRMHAHGSGANKKNVANITATADVDATITATIPAGKGQTLMAFIHIPYGSTGFMSGYYASMFRSTKVANAMGDIQLMSNLWGSDGEVVEHSMSVGASGGLAEKNFPKDNEKQFSQGTDIWIRSIETTDTNSTISAGFDIIIKPNE